MIHTHIYNDKINKYNYIKIQTFINRVTLLGYDTYTQNEKILITI